MLDTTTPRERDQRLLEDWTHTVYDRARRSGATMLEAAERAATYRQRMQLSTEPCSNPECERSRFHDAECVPFTERAEAGAR